MDINLLFIFVIFLLLLLVIQRSVHLILANPVIQIWTVDDELNNVVPTAEIELLLFQVYTQATRKRSVDVDLVKSMQKAHLLIDSTPENIPVGVPNVRFILHIHILKKHSHSCVKMGFSLMRQCLIVQELVSDEQ